MQVSLIKAFVFLFFRFVVQGNREVILQKMSLFIYVDSLEIFRIKPVWYFLMQNKVHLQNMLPMVNIGFIKSTAFESIHVMITAASETLKVITNI